jgi:hypothetical protein
MFSSHKPKEDASVFRSLLLFGSIYGENTIHFKYQKLNPGFSILMVSLEYLQTQV